MMKTTKNKPLPINKSVKKVLPAVIKKNVHYTSEYILNPPHPVTVNVIGCGGTGSQVINSLARMHSALKALGHPGLFVTAIDPDKVSIANMGRQLFSAADIGSYKCMVLIGRINRFFGTDWEGIPSLYNSKSKNTANITISCIDNGPGRKEIKNLLLESSKSSRYFQPYEMPYYWMDFGNMMDRGQVVISTISKITQPEKSEFNCLDSLNHIDHYHPEIFLKAKEGEQGPSCSLAEALTKQDLFINTNLANMGLGILWKMFREARIFYHGLYVNLNTLSVNPIKL